MTTIARTTTALAATILISATAEAATIKVAAWNLNNLHHVLGEPLRDRAPARSAEDYATLREYRDRVGADIYALQEVNGPKACARRLLQADAGFTRSSSTATGRKRTCETASLPSTPAQAMVGRCAFSRSPMRSQLSRQRT
jgi:hypothetical protein